MSLALVLLLAQTCVAEISFPSGTDECVAMWEVNARNAARRRVDIFQQTREFNAYWRSSEQRAQRPWVGELALDGAQPAQWPAHLSWERHRGRWGAVVERAGQFVLDYRLGRHRAVCPGADDYGGDPDDDAGAEDSAPCPEAIRLTCIPGALQAYWRLAGCRAARRQRQSRRAP